MAIDPVCGMTVDEATPVRAAHEGVTYYFCGQGCRTKFVANPAQYLDKTRGPEAMGDPDAIYTAPQAAKLAAMHPDTLRQKLRLGVIKGRNRGQWRVTGTDLLKFAGR